MSWRNSNLRLVIAVLLSFAMVGNGFGALYFAMTPCTGASVDAFAVDCGSSNNCCCGNVPQRACGCPSHDQPVDSPLPVGAQDHTRIIKWASSQAVFTFVLSLAPLARFTSAGRFDFASSERSIQTRLCKWRC